MTYIHDNTHGIIMFIILACGASEVILAFYAEEKKTAVCVFPGCGLVGFDLGLWCENVCLSLWLNRIQIQNPHLDLHHKHATQLDLHSKTAMQIHSKITYLVLAYNANHNSKFAMGTPWRASHDLGVCVEFPFQKKTPSNLAVSAMSATLLCHPDHLVCFWQFNRFLMLWLLWLKIRNDLLCHNDLWRGVFGITGVTTAVCHTHEGWVHSFPPQCKAQGQTVVTETLEPPSLKPEEKHEQMESKYI